MVASSEKTRTEKYIAVAKYMNISFLFPAIYIRLVQSIRMAFDWDIPGICLFCYAVAFLHSPLVPKQLWHDNHTDR